MKIAYAQETEPTTAAPADAGVLASLGINGVQFGEQLINFALIAVVLWFLILKPLTKKMTERAKLIDDSIEKAKRVEENLQKSEQKYQERVDAAKVEANKIVERAGAEATAAGEALKAKTKKEIETAVEAAKRQIVSEREGMVSELKSEVGELVAAALEKLIGEKLTAGKDKQIVEEMMKKMK